MALLGSKAAASSFGRLPAVAELGAEKLIDRSQRVLVDRTVIVESPDDELRETADQVEGGFLGLEPSSLPRSHFNGLKSAEF